VFILLSCKKMMGEICVYFSTIMYFFYNVSVFVDYYLEEELYLFVEVTIMIK